MILHFTSIKAKKKKGKGYWILQLRKRKKEKKKNKGKGKKKKNFQQINYHNTDKAIKFKDKKIKHKHEM